MAHYACTAVLYHHDATTPHVAASVVGALQHLRRHVVWRSGFFKKFFCRSQDTDYLIVCVLRAAKKLYMIVAYTIGSV